MTQPPSSGPSFSVVSSNSLLVVLALFVRALRLPYTVHSDTTRGLTKQMNSINSAPKVSVQKNR
jgi:hypothetical protein